MINHLILIGFKNAGKSTIGALLAEKLKRPFIDLDDEIVRLHSKIFGETLTCREILKKHGEETFREIEREALKIAILAPEPLVLALGGGTPLRADNRRLLKSHVIIHVTAPMGVIFERIMINGTPAFFPKNQGSNQAFEQLWSEREPIFKSLAKHTVKNSGTVAEAVTDLLKVLTP